MIIHIQQRTWVMTPQQKQNLVIVAEVGEKVD